jgi:hypothetical protein
MLYQIDMGAMDFFAFLETNASYISSESYMRAIIPLTFSKSHNLDSTYFGVLKILFLMT